MLWLNADRKVYPTVFEFINKEESSEELIKTTFPISVYIEYIASSCHPAGALFTNSIGLHPPVGNKHKQMQQTNYQTNKTIKLKKNHEWTSRCRWHIIDVFVCVCLHLSCFFVRICFVFVGKRLKSSYPGKRCPRVVGCGWSPNLFSNDKLMQKLLRQGHTCDSFTRIWNKNEAEIHLAQPNLH